MTHDGKTTIERIATFLARRTPTTGFDLESTILAAYLGALSIAAEHPEYAMALRQEFIAAVPEYAPEARTHGRILTRQFPIHPVDASGEAE